MFWIVNKSIAKIKKIIYFLLPTNDNPSKIYIGKFRLKTLEI